jgi:hypothetical protein
MMYFGIGCSPVETVYAGSYHFVDFKMDLIRNISERASDDRTGCERANDFD